MNLLALSAITHTRQRVGAAPVEWLFRQTAQTWSAERYLKDDWHTACNLLPLMAHNSGHLMPPSCVNIMGLPTHPL
ncbi:transposase domain-containing protein [Escherichia coli]|uniref:transposase domain-containing protein n=1 Tax=Escherichia coli TaxID=562 RepID=UPI000AE7C1CE